MVSGLSPDKRASAIAYGKKYLNGHHSSKNVTAILVNIVDRHRYGRFANNKYMIVFSLGGHSTLVLVRGAASARRAAVIAKLVGGDTTGTRFGVLQKVKGVDRLDVVDVRKAKANLKKPHLSYKAHSVGRISGRNLRRNDRGINFEDMQNLFSRSFHRGNLVVAEYEPKTGRFLENLGRASVSEKTISGFGRRPRVRRSAAKSATLKKKSTSSNRRPKRTFSPLSRKVSKRASSPGRAASKRASSGSRKRHSAGGRIAHKPHVARKSASAAARKSPSHHSARRGTRVRKPVKRY